MTTTINRSRCSTCGADVPGRARSGRRFCNGSCRNHARRLDRFRAKLAQPEPFPGAHNFARQQVAALEADVRRWKAANTDA